MLVSNDTNAQPSTKNMPHTHYIGNGTATATALPVVWYYFPGNAEKSAATIARLLSFCENVDVWVSHLPK